MKYMNKIYCRSCTTLALQEHSHHPSSHAIRHQRMQENPRRMCIQLQSNNNLPVSIGYAPEHASTYS